LGINNAPATPWSTRKATNMPVDVDSAHPSDISAKPMIPAKYTFLRP
jgi:hypothetical protein